MLSTIMPAALSGGGLTFRVSPPPERAAGIIVESIDELVDKLKNEAKVIS